MDEVAVLRRQVALREAELAQLKAELAVAEAETKTETETQTQAQSTIPEWKWPLERHQYERYSRQMVVPGFGLEGQMRINRAKILLVGAGGLGCPAAAYLAGAGVSVLGLVDGDTVELSNLHRQTAHATARVGASKVDSAIAYLKELNPTVRYVAHKTHLNNENAWRIVAQYDLVLDCTDRPASRYLVSDACVLLGKPLVSASAFQSSGQLIVLNCPPGKGPCYRCVFPKPPPPESVVGCGEGGILGPVVGVMGVLQALEAIKVILAGRHLEKKDPVEDGEEEERRASMLLFNGMADTPFRTVRMKGRRPGCFACSGGESALTLEELRNSLDYVQFCGVNAPLDILLPDERITVEEYHAVSLSKKPHLLIDVREKEHYDMCHLQGSMNIPIGRFTSHREKDADADEGSILREWIPEELPPDAPIYVICRVGNDSQIAARRLKGMGGNKNGRFIGDVKGGMKAWREGVDATLPFV